MEVCNLEPGITKVRLSSSQETDRANILLDDLFYFIFIVDTIIFTSIAHFNPVPTPPFPLANTTLLLIIFQKDSSQALTRFPGF